MGNNTKTMKKMESEFDNDIDVELDFKENPVKFYSNTEKTIGGTSIPTAIEDTTVPGDLETDKVLEKYKPGYYVTVAERTGLNTDESITKGTLIEDHIKPGRIFKITKVIELKDEKRIRGQVDTGFWVSIANPEDGFKWLEPHQVEFNTEEYVGGALIPESVSTKKYPPLCAGMMVPESIEEDDDYFEAEIPLSALRTIVVVE